MDWKEADIAIQEIWLKEQAEKDARLVCMAIMFAAQAVSGVLNHKRNINNARRALTGEHQAQFLELAAWWRKSYITAVNELAHISDDMG